MAWKSNTHVKTEIPWSLIPIELPFKQPPRQYVSFQNLETTATIPLNKVGFTFDPRLIPPDLLHISIPPPPEITIASNPSPKNSNSRDPSSEILVPTEPLPVLPDFSSIRPKAQEKTFFP